MPIRLKKFWKAGTLAALATILAILDQLYDWGFISELWALSRSIVALVVNSPIPTAIVVLSIIVAALFFNYLRLAKYVAISFRDNFRKQLNRNWDFQGGWKQVHGHELLVTQSDIGGITKVGQLWTDYRFEFKTIIVNDRIGWIVRAQDLFNYYMIQLTPSHIRPHLRFAGTWILLGDRAHNQQITVNRWFRIRTEVRGLEIRIYIDDQEVYYNNDFFSMKFLQFVPQQGGGQVPHIVPPQPNTVIVPAYTTGRVGFRMWGTEEGRISRLSVRPL